MPNDQNRRERQLTHDELKAAEAAFKGRAFNEAWSLAAREVYDGILMAKITLDHEWLTITPMSECDLPYTMPCRWCGALMVKEQLYDYVQNNGHYHPAALTWAYRCVACANVVSAMRQAA